MKARIWVRWCPDSTLLTGLQEQHRAWILPFGNHFTWWGTIRSCSYLAPVVCTGDFKNRQHASYPLEDCILMWKMGPWRLSSIAFSFTKDLMMCSRKSSILRSKLVKWHLSNEQRCAHRSLSNKSLLPFPEACMLIQMHVKKEDK